MTTITKIEKDCYLVFFENCENLESIYFSILSLRLDTSIEDEIVVDLIGKKLVAEKEGLNLTFGKDPKKFINHIQLTHLSRLIDTFECYLKDIITELYLANPQKLKSANIKNLNFEDLANAKDKDEVIKFLIEKALNDLFFSSFPTIIDIIKKVHLLEKNPIDTCSV